MRNKDIYVNRKPRERRGFDFYAIFLVIVVILCLLIDMMFGCTKEPDPVFIDLKPRYSIEGTYDGVYSLNIPGLGYNVTHQNIITISAVNAEQLLIQNMGITGAAYMSNTNGYYHYSTFYWYDVTDCGKNVLFTFSSGTGYADGDSLTEAGQVLALYNGIKYPGTWGTKSVKKYTFKKW